MGSTIAGTFVVAAGVLVLVGWTFDMPITETLAASWVTMKANTALGFVFGGFALLFSLSADAERPLRMRAAQICAAAVGLIGLLDLAEYIFGWDLGIDQLLFADVKALADGKMFPGRMSPITAANFTLLGMALLRLRKPASGWPAIGDAPVVLAFLSSYLALVGYLYDVKALYAAFSYTAVALNTAVAFLALSAGTMLARPDRGVMRLIASGHAGGVMARRLLPFAMVIPIVLGWLRLEGQKRGLFGFELGTALLVSANTVLFISVILWSVNSLDEADRERQQLDVVRRLNAELDERVSELRAANKDLEAFSYTVAHDLRAPLRAIDGFSQALLEDHAERLPEEAKSLLQIVIRNTAQMARLIEGLLAFSRLGRQALRMQRVELDDLVPQILADLDPDRDRVQISVGDLGAVDGDPGLLRQVFANLLGNAVKFTRNKNPAKIAIGCSNATEPAEEKIYFVADNGAGFDMQHVQQLFGVFQRLHKASEYEGTGIGLATVQRIVERHGGRIWAQAKVNEGATFYFTLRGGPTVAAHDAAARNVASKNAA